MIKKTFKSCLIVSYSILYVEGCLLCFITGKIDETEGTSLGLEIENLLSAATIEEQLHILKNVSLFLRTVILKLSDGINGKGL